MLDVHIASLPCRFCRFYVTCSCILSSMCVSSVLNSTRRAGSSPKLKKALSLSRKRKAFATGSDTAGKGGSIRYRSIGPSDGLESSGDVCSADIRSAANEEEPRSKVRNYKADPCHASATINLDSNLLQHSRFWSLISISLQSQPFHSTQWREP
jgi:hypothetical protein